MYIETLLVEATGTLSLLFLIVLDQGEIIERGHHEQLLKKEK